MVGMWYYNQLGVTELLIMRDPHYQVIMVIYVLSQLKPSELYILSCENASAWTFLTAENVELLKSEL